MVLGRKRVSSLERCPYCRGVLIEVIPCHCVAITITLLTLILCEGYLEGYLGVFILPYTCNMPKFIIAL